MKKTTSFVRNVIPLFILIAAIFGCDAIKNLTGGDRLYFCEKYIPSTDKCEGESSKFTTGVLTVMVKLSEPIGETDVNINVTNIATDKVVETIPFTVTPDMDYIFFENVAFEDPGEYRVSLLKSDKSVVVSSNIEIVSR